jgi:hypothetical protein
MDFEGGRGLFFRSGIQMNCGNGRLRGRTYVLLLILIMEAAISITDKGGGVRRCRGNIRPLAISAIERGWSTIFGVCINTLSLRFTPAYTPSRMSCRGGHGDNRFYIFRTKVCPFKDIHSTHRSTNNNRNLSYPQLIQNNLMNTTISKLQSGAGGYLTSSRIVTRGNSGPYVSPVSGLIVTGDADP